MYLVLARKHLTLVQWYKDKDTLNTMEDMHQTLQAMLAEAQNNDMKMDLRQSKFVFSNLYVTCL